MCELKYTGAENDTFKCREGNLDENGNFSNITYETNSDLTTVETKLLNISMDAPFTGNFSVFFKRPFNIIASGMDFVLDNKEEPMIWAFGMISDNLAQVLNNGSALMNLTKTEVTPSGGKDNEPIEPISTGANFWNYSLLLCNIIGATLLTVMF